MATLSQLAIERATSRDQRLTAVQQAYEQSLVCMDNTYLFLQECAALDLKLPEPAAYWQAESPVYDFDIKTEEGKFAFRVIKEIVGDLEEDGLEPYDSKKPDNPDRRKRLVRVTCRSMKQEFKHIRFRYIKRLPKEASCRLVKEITKHTRLVCE